MDNNIFFDANLMGSTHSQQELNSFDNEIKENFIVSIELNDMESVKNLIQPYIEIIKKKSEIPFPLGLKMAIDTACKSGIADIFLFLLTTFQSHYLTENYSLDILKYSVQKCIECEYYEIVHLIIHKKCLYIDFYLKILEYDFDKLFSYKYDFDKNLALKLAIEKNKIDFIKAYIDDVDINADDGILLRTAIIHNRLDIAQLLINSGACVNDNNRSFMFHALMNYNIEMVQLLINSGIDLKTALTTSYSSLLPMQSEHPDLQKSKEIITLLVNSGANLEDFANMMYNKLFPEKGIETNYTR